MPRLEGWPAPRCSQCENQECTCNANTTGVATANTTEVATAAKAVVYLTVELPPTYAAELAELLARHVDWEDFPWAEAIYDAICPKDAHRTVVFSDVKYGTNVFLRRKKD